jgi:hypothetical protein
LPRQRDSLAIVLQAVETRLVEAIKEDVADGFADDEEDHPLGDLPPLLRAARVAAMELVDACRATRKALVPNEDGGVSVIGPYLPRASGLIRAALLKAVGGYSCCD